MLVIWVSLLGSLIVLSNDSVSSFSASISSRVPVKWLNNPGSAKI